MQASILSFKQKKFVLTKQLDFFLHLSLLGAFIGLLGYLAIVCHHLH